MYRSYQQDDDINGAPIMTARFLSTGDQVTGLSSYTQNKENHLCKAGLKKLWYLNLLDLRSVGKGQCVTVKPTPEGRHNLQSGLDFICLLLFDLR